MKAEQVTSAGYRSQVTQALKATFRLRAKQLASGLRAGNHRAALKGSGVEFAGHRPYSPGDDLRYLDRHALLRHGRHLIRQFLTDTERSLHLVVDTTSSMRYAGLRPETEGKAKSAEAQSKGEAALLLAGALAFSVRRSSDCLGLSLVTDEQVLTLPPGSTPSLFEEIEARLEDEYARGKSPAPPAQKHHDGNRETWRVLLAHLGSRLPSGSVIVVLSDFLDFTAPEIDGLSALFSNKRTVRAAQILSPNEWTFPYEGSLRFLDPESGRSIETDARSVRDSYQSALTKLTTALESALVSRGGTFLRLSPEKLSEAALSSLLSGTRGDVP